MGNIAVAYFYPGPSLVHSILEVECICGSGRVEVGHKKFTADGYPKP